MCVAALNVYVMNVYKAREGRNVVSAAPAAHLEWAGSVADPVARLRVSARQLSGRTASEHDRPEGGVAMRVLHCSGFVYCNEG